MEALTSQDLRSILAFMDDTRGAENMEDYRRRVIAALPRLVGADCYAYTELNVANGAIENHGQPAELFDSFPDSYETFARLSPEHPVIDHHRRTGDGTAHKISDFLDHRRYRRGALYNEFYRHFYGENHMALALPAPPPLIIGIALNRRGRDFTERERSMLNAVRGHLADVYRLACDASEYSEHLALLAEAEPRDGLGLVLVDRLGRIAWLNHRAEEQLEVFFGVEAAGPPYLPLELQQWLSCEPTASPLQIVQAHRRALVHASRGAEGGRLLRFEEPVTGPDPDTLRTYGLTESEARVLVLVAQGKRNKEIAERLEISHRTVQKHLEHVYRKLDLQGRAAAIAWTLGTHPKP